MDKENFELISNELKEKNVALVAVSKTKPAKVLMELYQRGQKDFGENFVQELLQKEKELPKDIRWHFIGHLQTNKVKQIAPFIHLIHSVDSFKLLTEINKQAEKNDSVIDCLLQIYIATEETKFGLNEEELNSIIQQFDNSQMKNVRIVGLMGMASFTDDENKIRKEFKHLKSLFDKFSIVNSQFSILSMGMSSDYKIAIEEGSTMVRIGSLLFGKR